jgi:hypothetical protein
VRSSAWIFSDWVWGMFADSSSGFRWGRWYEDARRWFYEPIHPVIVEPHRLTTVPARAGERPDLVRWTEPRKIEW